MNQSIDFSQLMRFKTISACYAILSDAEQRRVYDSTGIVGDDVLTKSDDESWYGGGGGGSMIV